MKRDGGGVSRVNPYKLVLQEGRDWMFKLLRPTRLEMCTYPAARLKEGWALAELWQRVAAAKQLGFDVQLRAEEKGLIVEYVEKRPDTLPWRFQP